MSHLFTPISSPPPEIGFVAVAINHEGLHIALLFRLEVDVHMRVLHLAWDHDLRNQKITPKFTNNYLATTFPIGPIRSKAVAHYCLTVFEANSGGIPYAFGDPCGSFDANGVFVAGRQRVGLTCASFVVAVLEQAGVNIVGREGWGPNLDDAQFFAWVIRALMGEIRGIPPAARPEHAAKVAAQVEAGAVRYRPLEVAGAATSDRIPVDFAAAVRLGKKLKPRLLRSANVPPHMI